MPLELPADLADPLHLTNPYRSLFTLLGLLLLIALLWLLRRRSRRGNAVKRPRVSSRSGPSASTIDEAIEAIRGRYKHADRRRGCHELSELTRAHFERLGRYPLTTLTAREIAEVLNDQAPSSFFELLAELQFGRHEPSGEDFRGICDLAGEAVSRRRPS